MNKKILHVTDFALNEYNSVRDISYALVNHPSLHQYTHVFSVSRGNHLNTFGVSYIEGYKTYTSYAMTTLELVQNHDLSVFKRIKLLTRRTFAKILSLIHMDRSYYAHTSMKYLKHIIKLEKPSMVCLFTGTPDPDYVKACLKCKTPYINMLYDTYIERPNKNKEAVFQTESYVLKHSVGYFVPGFFYKGYISFYNSSKLKSYNLPLLIDKDTVLKAYKEASTPYEFTYFGQIQKFRNGDKISAILKRLELVIDIFTTQKIESNDVFRVHPAVTGDDLCNIVAGSKYLIAIDNSAPYDHYLPSKAYLYASFTKPIIIFGDNETSALKDFFKDYPFCYYQHLDEPLDGLVDFLAKPFPTGFNNDIYSQYLQYLPQNALKPILELIDEALQKG